MTQNLLMRIFRISKGLWQYCIVSDNETTKETVMSVTLTAGDLMADLTATPQAEVLVANKVIADKEAEVGNFPDFSPVSGHGHAESEHYRDFEALHAVEVIGYADLLGKIFPGYWDKSFEEMDYEADGLSVAAWAEANDAHIFVWEGYSFGGGAMTHQAVANAVALGKSKVVIESLG